MKQKNRLKAPPFMTVNQKGFTMMEFLVAAILGLIVILAVGKTYTATSQLNQRGEERLAIQQDIRSATTMIARDAHMAGNFGCLSLANAAYAGSNGLNVNVHDASPTFTGNYPIVNGGVIEYGVKALNSVPVSSTIFTLDGNALFFQYGVGAATLKSLTVSGSNIGTATFSADKPNQKELLKTVSNNGYVVLASCSRMDVLKSSASNINGSDVNFGTGLPIGGTDTAKNFHTANNLEVMRYVMHIYAVGTYDGVKGLYRFSLGSNGAWNTVPQLLSPNVTAMNIRFGYSNPNNCDDDASENTENFTFANNAVANFPPSLLQLTLNVSGEADAQIDGLTRTSTYQTTATIRGGNVCASRSLKD